MSLKSKMKIEFWRFSILYISWNGLKMMHIMILLHSMLAQYSVSVDFFVCVWNRRSALMLACESDSVEIVEALLPSGANTQLVDALGNTAMDYSVAMGTQHVIQMLQDGAPPGSFFSFIVKRYNQSVQLF